MAFALVEGGTFLTAPASFISDIDKLNKSDIDIVNKLRNTLLNLIYEGKNSPIIKNLFIASILEITEMR